MSPMGGRRLRVRVGVRVRWIGTRVRMRVTRCGSRRLRNRNGDRREVKSVWEERVRA